LPPGAPRLDPENRLDERSKASENRQETVKAGKLAFAGFVLDRGAGRLLGQAGEVRLRPQAFRLLEVLVEAAPRILSQDELLDQAWGVEHLSPTSVKQAVSEIRQALGDDPVRPSIIETVHRRGYRVIAQVKPLLRTPDLSTRPIQSVPEEREAPVDPVQERVRSRRAGVLLAALALAALSLGVGARLMPEARVPGKVPARSAVPVARPALAILGFKNLSADPQDDWLSGALSEVLAFELTTAGRVRLIPGENVAWMKKELSLSGDENQSRAGLGRIARNLGTDLVLTGSYLKEDGGRLRLQVLVQDARTGETVAWAREAGTRDALSSLATAAARGLQATLGGPAGGTAPAEAVAIAESAASAGSLRYYSEALEHLRVWDATTALDLLEKAAALDPNSPFVQDALAGAAFRLGFGVKAREAAGRAVELSTNLPRQVRLGLEGRAHELRGEWDQAAAIYTELRRAYPDDLEYGLRLAGAQLSAGRTPASLATAAGLRRLAPPAGDDPRLDLAEGEALFKLGDYRRAVEAAERGIAGAERRGMALVAAGGRTDRAWALARLGRPAEALADFAVARTLYLRTGDRGAAAASQLGHASVLQSTGRTTEAWKGYEEGISTLRAIGDRRREAKALNNFAAVLSEEGDYAGIQPLLERSLAIKRETGDLQGAATTLVGLGNLFRVRGDLRSAHLRVEEALDLSRGLGDGHDTAFALRAFARILIRENRVDEARSALEEAISLTTRMGEGDGTAEARLALGDLEAKTGHPERARAELEQALAAFRRMDEPGDAAFTLLRLGGLSQDEKRYDEARTHYTEALLLARKGENDFYAAHSHVGLAEVAVLQSRLDVARAEYRQALAMWEEQKNADEAAKVKKALAEIAGGAGIAGKPS
jgi:tetratricopeptide (TPR) repeat protein/DNA-binding winged helix-turn-helix (wHTH) protein